MHQSVFLDSYIHKATEVSDIRHNARQHHAFLQIIDGMNIGVKAEFLNLAARIAPRLIQFLHDILQGRHTDFIRLILFQTNLLLQLLPFHQFTHRTMQVCRHLFHHRITFRMDSRIIQRVASIGNTQETGTLLESLLA